MRRARRERRLCFMGYIMSGRFERLEILLGGEAVKKLSSVRVAVFGLGGVGGYTVEALARSGVGAIDVIDGDTVEITNVNRQIYAVESALGCKKAEVAAQRILDINPECKVKAHTFFYGEETAGRLNFEDYDYVADAIDDVRGKICIIERAHSAGVPVISCMGAGNKLNASAFKVADISRTSVCPLAKIMRRELKKRGIENVKTVYSEELPHHQEVDGERKTTIGSAAFVTPVAGLVMAGEIIKDLINPDICRK